MPGVYIENLPHDSPTAALTNVMRVLNKHFFIMFICDGFGSNAYTCFDFLFNTQVYDPSAAPTSIEVSKLFLERLFKYRSSDSGKCMRLKTIRLINPSTNGNSIKKLLDFLIIIDFKL